MGSVTQDGKALRKLRYGLRVDRATATLPQSTSAAIFNILEGRVIINGIIGEVTTIMQTQANNVKLTANPTTGTSVDICAQLDTSADEAGTIYGITGTFATALVSNVAGATVMCATPVVLNIGTLDLYCSASNTGNVKWTIYYVPDEDGAYITAA